MQTKSDALSRLPELPVELFELSGKLGYSERAPVITIKPDAVIMEPPEISTAIPVKTSCTTTTYFVWVIYPQVICYPFPDERSLAFVKLQNSKPDLHHVETDLRSIASASRYFKLSRLQGVDLPTRYGCHVQYGPWAAHVTQTESCFVGGLDRWELSSSVLDMSVQWSGQWEDIPSVPNLTVVMGSLSNGVQQFPPVCCPGNSWCPTTGSCLSSQLPCKPPMV